MCSDHVHEGTFDDGEHPSAIRLQAALKESVGLGRGRLPRAAMLPRDGSCNTPAFVGCSYSERLVFLQPTFISGRPKEMLLAPLAALNRLVVEKVGLRPEIIFCSELLNRRGTSPSATVSRSGADLGLSAMKEVHTRHSCRRRGLAKSVGPFAAFGFKADDFSSRRSGHSTKR